VDRGDDIARRLVFFDQPGASRLRIAAFMSSRACPATGASSPSLPHSEDSEETCAALQLATFSWQRCMLDGREFHLRAGGSYGVASRCSIQTRMDGSTRCR
jgi:hypothetical protein